MKVVTFSLTVLSVVSAFGTDQVSSRKAFLSSAAAALTAPLVANAGTMAQENISTPTEQWETGSPTEAAAKARKERFSQARTQMSSSFPPIKRLTLERKSPVTRLDINAPYFTEYKKTYPGLYKKASGAKVVTEKK
mmetsp:Transcript_16343/g.18850  ORF Transcript_16343/g.18850 Transcript_16343/m.18850 type:complete len:136 (-) Transcript_16343:217-624(-)|eukprot:CAMPEP_0194145404 /NCGR_PEP_ID=MMETSP0152-20130528/17405_1 /TAXON_ID=1049557 /ORGANISM="Thalassiothrix antarctica, Strain L6-D1" /LENGTH=135 /DNA_ID=CAMNT_0038845635 /DNA_START=99 /DNA_END=506 /DNA_ORIENTATION=+